MILQVTWSLQVKRLVGYLVPMAAIALVALYLSLPMVQNSYPMTHSTQFNLSWAFQYQRQFLGGQFYPKWLEFSNFGFGNPTFEFYPPMCMVMTLPFRLLGLDMPGSLLASMMLAIATLGAGLYLYARYFWGAGLALLVAELGMTSPYFLLDIYHRGALGEVWAISWIPWILLASQKVIEQPGNFLRVVSLAIAYGLLVLSHLPTLLLFTLIYALKPILASQDWQSCRLNLQKCATGILLGWGWTSFFILPVVLDQKLVNIASLTESLEYQAQGRLMLDGLLQFAPRLPTHWFETGSGLILFWWWSVSLVIISLVGLKWRSPKAVPWKFWLGVSVIALVMMTDLGGWIYHQVAVLNRIQFSWRWFHILVISLPLLLGYLLDQVAKFNQVKFVLVAVALSTSLWQTQAVLNRAYFDPGLVQQFSQLAEQKNFPLEPNTEAQAEKIFGGWHWIYPEGLALGDVPEYRPRLATLNLPPQGRNYPRVALDQGDQGKVLISRWQFGDRQFFVDSANGDQNYQITLRMLAYPGWGIELDGKSYPLQANSEGQITLDLTPGKHEITLHYGGTKAEWLGLGVTLITILVSLWYLYLHRFDPMLTLPWLKQVQYRDKAEPRIFP
ncbi:MAG: hypothetical protein SFT94_12730 [Pseudanabaenaceae cyanobacterium bins.68]|nr:hypothetical protein [Pseudanabaenaceae cyanobacterium bins.68]